MEDIDAIRVKLQLHYSYNLYFLQQRNQKIEGDAVAIQKVYNKKKKM